MSCPGFLTGDLPAAMAACGAVPPGMGLYLAKKLADALEISLAIRSEEGVGTQVLLTFPAQEKLTKL